MQMISKKVLSVVGALTVVAALGVFAVSAAFAQSATPTTPSQGQSATGQQGTTQSGSLKGLEPGLGFGFRGGSTADFDAMAKALNLTPTQLFEQLHSGKTLSEIATAQGVDLQAVQDAANAQRVQSMKDSIAQAVTDGTMTQAKADWLLEGLDKGYLNGADGIGIPGLGGRHGGGRGGPGGLFGGQQQTTPATPATPSTGTTG
jgi:hypothetical protein